MTNSLNGQRKCAADLNDNKEKANKGKKQTFQSQFCEVPDQVLP